MDSTKQSLIIIIVLLLMSFSTFFSPTQLVQPIVENDLLEENYLDEIVFNEQHSTDTSEEFKHSSHDNQIITSKMDLNEDCMNDIDDGYLDNSECKDRTHDDYYKEIMESLDYTGDNENGIAEKQAINEKVVDRLLVKFSSFTSRDVFLSSLSDGVDSKSFSAIPYASITRNKDVISLLQTSTGITDIVADNYEKIVDFDNNEHLEFNPIQWYNTEGRIGTWEMHDLGFTGKGIKIAVIDTGIDSNHPDLQTITNGSTKIIAEASFVDYGFDGIMDVDPADGYGHGTHVAGTAAANGYHVGIAPDAYLINAKAVDNWGNSYPSWVVDAVEWAVLEAEADIVTMSIGWNFDSFGVNPALNDIVDWAWDQGVIVTIAAANSGPDPVTIASPGMSRQIITVGASDYYNHVVPFSSRGPQPFGYPDPDICAPGVEVFSCTIGGSYALASGTSMATPHLAGAAALLLESHPSATPDQIKVNLMKNAEILEHSTSDQGAGQVDIINTHDNWSDNTTIVYPALNSMDRYYLSPGESYEGYFVILSGESPGAVPSIMVTGGNLTGITIDNSDLINTAGHQFIPFNIIAPSQTGDLYWTEINEIVTSTIINITVIIVDVEDDADSGTDAGDIFSSALSLELGNFYGMLNDDDYFAIELNASETYSFDLNWTDGSLDLDLVLYDADGIIQQLSDAESSYILEEQIIIRAPYTGKYYLRIMLSPYSWLLEYITDRSYFLKLYNGMPEENYRYADVTPLGYDMYGLDDDADGTFEYMAINITLDVNRPGLWTALLFLALNKTGGSYRYVYTTIDQEKLMLNNFGIQNVTVLVNGEHIANQQYIGAHVISSIYFFDPYKLYSLYGEGDVYTSKVFDSADFGPVHIHYKSLMAKAVDTDTDGYDDHLEVVVKVEVHVPPNDKSFKAYITYPDGKRVTSDYPAELDASYAGEQTLSFCFDISSLRFSFNGTVNLELLSFFSGDYTIIVGEVITVTITGPTWYGSTEFKSIEDTGLDTDGDGNFDYLVFNITFQIDRAGYYTVVSSSALWSVFSQKIVWNARMEPAEEWHSAVLEYYETGTYMTDFRFSGEVINATGADGPFMLMNLYLVDEQNIIDRRGHVITTSTPYKAADFDQTAWIFNRIIDEEVIDNDRDGYEETLELIIEAQFIRTGNFTVSVDLVSYPEYGMIVNENTTEFEISNTGIQNISIQFDGLNIWKHRYTGYMDLYSLIILQTNNSYPVYANYNLGLLDVNWNDLPGAAPARFLYQFADYPQGDIPHDNINIEVDINIRISSEYDFIIYLYISDLYPYYLGNSNYFDQGNHTLVFSLTAQEYVVYFEDGILSIVELAINGNEGKLWREEGSFYNTSAYVRNEFNFEQPLVFTGNYGLSEVDDDGNGLFEGLVFTVEVDVIQSSYYWFYMHLFNEEGSWIYQLSYEGELSTGVTQVSFKLSAYEWVRNKESIFYHYDDYLQVGVVRAYNLGPYPGNDQAVVFDHDVLITPCYSCNDFQQSLAATFTGSIFSEFGDEDGNGLFETVNFIITINISKIGEYTIYYDLGIEYCTEFFCHGQLIDEDYRFNFAVATIGEMNITVKIPVSVYYSRSTEGICEFLSAEIYYQDGFRKDKRRFNYGTEYKIFDDFEDAVIITDISDRGLDINSNELYDYLFINVSISVNVPGNYILSIGIYHDLLWHVATSEVVFTVEGDRERLSLPMLFSAGDLQDYLDYNTYFDLRVDLSKDSISVAADTCTTRVYSSQDWEETGSSPSSARIISITNRELDEDGEGHCDHLAIEVTVEIDQVSNYKVTMELMHNSASIAVYSETEEVYSPSSVIFSFNIPVEDLFPVLEGKQHILTIITLFKGNDTQYIDQSAAFISVDTSNWLKAEYDTSTSIVTTEVEYSTTTKASAGYNLIIVFLTMLGLVFLHRKKK